MALRPNTNYSELISQKWLNSIKESIDTPEPERLNRSVPIKSATDNAVHFAISDQIPRINRALRNANAGISLLQIAEGAIDESVNILQRIRDLTEQSINSTTNASDRTAMNNEVQALISEIDRIANETTFGDNKIFAKGGFSIDLQVGADVGETLTLPIEPFDSTDLGVGVVSSNFSTIVGENDSDFASRLRIQFASALFLSTLNGATLTDIAANQNSVNKVKAVTSNTSASAFIFGNSLVGTTNTANAHGGIKSSEIMINDIKIDSSKGTVVDMVDQINLKKGEHGVVADATAGGTLVLFNRDGRAITLKVNSANAATATGFANGSVNSVTTGDNGAIVLTTANASIGLLKAININTIDGARIIAKPVVDAAIETLNTNRSTFANVQETLASIITNSPVMNVIQKGSAFTGAAETDSLTKEQILYQAGTTNLAQANAKVSHALSLLG